METRVMFPVWFFILLVVFVCYLMYVTRTSDEDLLTKEKQSNGVRYLIEDKNNS